MRGSVLFHEVLTWDRTKATSDLLALDRKAFVKRCFELGLVHPVGVQARKALLAGAISYRSYLRVLGLTA